MIVATTIAFFPSSSMLSGASRPMIWTLAATIFAVFAITAQPRAQTNPGGENYDPYALTPAQKETVEKIAKAPADVSALRAPTGEKGREELQGGVPKIVLPLSDGNQITLTQTRTTIKRNGGFTWRGEVEETGERAGLMLWNDGRLSGFFAYRGRVYVVDHSGGNIRAVPEADLAALPPDHATSSPDTSAAGKPPSVPPEPIVTPLSAAERATLESKTVTIDLMLLYTKKAITNYMLDPADLMELAVDRANETFSNSGIGNVRLRLVHSQAVDYDETGQEHFSHLYRMVDSVGPFAAVKALRNEYRADVVGLVVDDPSGCGLSVRVGAESEEAFFVVHHACAALTYSIAHEIGHILGTRHDRATDAISTPFAYGHGYVNGAKWRDMMSYRASCGGCPQIPFWSNPRVMYKGEPTGTLASDTARVILEQAERVANFR